MALLTLDLKQKLLDSLEPLEKADLGTFDNQGVKISDQPDGKITLNSSEASKLFEILDKDSNELMDKIRLGEHKIHFSASGARALFYDTVDGSQDGQINLAGAQAAILNSDEVSLAESLKVFIDESAGKAIVYKDEIGGHLKKDFSILTDQLTNIRLALSVFCNSKNDGIGQMYFHILNNEL